MGAWASEMLNNKKLDHIFAQAVAAELGKAVPSYGMGAYNVTGFFAKCEPRDMLDSITLVAHALQARGGNLKRMRGPNSPTE